MVDECEPAVEPAVGAASPEAAVGPADAAAEAPIASTDHMEAPEKKSDQSEPPPGRPRALTRQGSLIIYTNTYLINNNTYNTKYESSRIVLYCCITTAARTHTRARLVHTTTFNP